MTLGLLALLGLLARLEPPDPLGLLEQMEQTEPPDPLERLGQPDLLGLMEQTERLAQPDLRLDLELRPLQPDQLESPRPVLTLQRCLLSRYLREPLDPLEPPDPLGLLARLGLLGLMAQTGLPDRLEPLDLLGLPPDLEHLRPRLDQ